MWGEERDSKLICIPIGCFTRLSIGLTACYVLFMSIKSHLASVILALKLEYPGTIRIHDFDSVRWFGDEEAGLQLQQTLLDDGDALLLA